MVRSTLLPSPEARWPNRQNKDVDNYVCRGVWRILEDHQEPIPKSLRDEMLKYLMIIGFWLQALKT